MDEQGALSLVADFLDGPSDDAAIVDGTVLTIDMLHESADFPPGTSHYTAGWRSVGVSLSDVAAMGAEATATVAAMGVPDFEAEKLEPFLKGARAVSEAVGAGYVGGDLDSHSEFTVATAAIGHTTDPVTRDGASPGDVVCVTGTLGRTAAGIRAFEAGAIDLGNELFQFTPRVAAGRELATAATAMMDSSDGLARSLHQLAAASGVGFAIDGSAVPITDDLDTYLGIGTDPLEEAITYGGDFELVCTLPEERVETVRETLSVPLSVLGTVEPADAGIELDGEPLEDEGYTHGSS
ncbi:MAG: thiamine-phosphate kinase [Halodesulfurarchaeum sp.]|nr:thiamine-phosphate kinase [Halodesulfurarchaeum sp.]